MKRKKLPLTPLPVICLAMFLFVGMASSAGGESETFKEITAPEVKNMLEKENALVVHVLTELEYDAQHISGSINIPVVKMKTTEKLPKDKKKPLIFYCMGKR
ncbi:rhodanese-like domain-containing protein [Desulfobacterales bacterium HSG2]|nr:rhodanese-like domain-containing protein [Desulfobacterales bacterium HSG2]